MEKPEEQECVPVPCEHDVSQESMWESGTKSVVSVKDSSNQE